MPDLLNDGAPSITFETRLHILSDYIESLTIACRVYGIPISDVEYSERELKLALDEADIDLRAMFARRCRKDGISQGKIAGIIAFRLSRFKILHFSGYGQNAPAIFMVQDLAAIILVRRLIVRRPISAKRMHELAYQMSRRHANQEALGIIFDFVMGN